MTDINGFLLVDKPQGWTSFDVVAKVRGVITKEIRDIHKLRGFCRDEDSAEKANSRQRYAKPYSSGAEPTIDEATSTYQKSDNDIMAGEQAFRCKCRVRVGHAGTLDPMATGLLVLAIGKATKQIDQMMKQDKIYEAEITLGKTSTTDDKEGQISDVSGQQPTPVRLEEVLEKFVGKIEQIPPQYSAIKVNGKRAYKSARNGEKVELKSRTVTIKSIKDLRYDYPTLSFIVDVSSGTYIRSLARDIGKELGVGAYLSQLRRETIGEFSVRRAIKTNELNIEHIKDSILTINI